MKSRPEIRKLLRFFHKESFKEKKKIGLALGSGSARGLAHIGVLKVLESNSVPIDYIVGSSMGAFIGALYAGGLSVKQLEDIACNVDWKLTTKMFAPTLPWNGLVAGNQIREFIKTLVGDININNLKIPFAAVATDVMNGEKIVIEQGSLVEAIRASISIPGIFIPVQYENRFLVDGGVANPVPVDVVKTMGADIVIAVNVTPSLAPALQNITLPDETPQKHAQQALTAPVLNTRLARYVQDKVHLNHIVTFVEHLTEKKQILGKKFNGPNIVETIMQSIGIMENEIIQLQFEKCRPDILIKPAVDHYGLMDFTKANELIDIGEEAAVGAIPLIKQLVN